MQPLRHLTTFLVVAFAFPSIVLAQLPSGWKAHDYDRPRPEVVTPGASNLPAPPPSDAIVLFDGASLDAWRDAEGNSAKWIIKDNVMESVPGSGYIFTAQAFGDIQLHVEWASPAMVEGKSQGRGNSGVFLMGLFEVQVLDSFDNVTYADGQAGALYGQYPPLVNASRGPGDWQAYDIVFHRPRFGTNGSMSEPARLTVLHNGVLIQDNETAYGPTAWLQFEQPTPHPNRLPLSFQDHGNPVRYRNIWLRELPDNPRPRPTKPYDSVVIQLSNQQLDRLVGKYGNNMQIVREGRELQLKKGGRRLNMIAHSETEFGLQYTAANLTFANDKEGNVESLKYEMGGDTSVGKRE